jgi:hypothetical protein
MIDIEKPLLEIDINKEFYNLEDEYKFFLLTCEITEKEINSLENIQDKDKMMKMYKYNLI